MKKNKYYLLDKKLNTYLINYIIPDVIAFYFKEIKYLKLENNTVYINHLNSICDLFNIRLDKYRLYKKINKILKHKYNLIIIEKEPLIIKNI